MTSTSSAPSATSSSASDDGDVIYNGLAGSEDGGSGSTTDNAAFRAADSNGLFGFVVLAASVCLGVFAL